jgi:DNA-binding MarR family transcriptional regulator
MQNIFRGAESKRKILDILEKSSKPLKQKELQKLTGLTKTNLKHHVDKLCTQNILLVDKQENTKGRPTLISVNQEHIKRQQDILKKIKEDYNHEMIKNEHTLFVLKQISSGIINEADIYINASEHFKQPSCIAEVGISIGWLKANSYIESTFILSGKAKKFLESQD